MSPTITCFLTHTGLSRSWSDSAPIWNKISQAKTGCAHMPNNALIMYATHAERR